VEYLFSEEIIDGQRKVYQITDVFHEIWGFTFHSYWRTHPIFSWSSNPQGPENNVLDMFDGHTLPSNTAPLAVRSLRRGSFWSSLGFLAISAMPNIPVILNSDD
jgi:hypothetical protein